MIVSHGGQVFLIDFGGMETVSEDPKTGELSCLYGKVGIHTTGYSAPESIHEVSDLGDIYSLGCTACHLLLNRPHPVRQQTDVPILIKEIREKYDPDLADVIEACLMESPNSRREAIKNFGQNGRTTADMLRRHLSRTE